MNSLRRRMASAAVFASVAGLALCPSSVARADDGDPSGYFGTAGVVNDTGAIPPTGGTQSKVVAISDDAAGNLYVVFRGGVWNGLAKYDYTGERDPSFGTNGVFLFVGISAPYDVAVREDGHIVVGGRFVSSGDIKSYAVINPTGTVALFPEPPLPLNADRETRRVLNLPDGRILLGGVSELGFGARVMAPNGVVSAVLSNPVPPFNTQWIDEMIVLADGHVLVQTDIGGTTCRVQALMSSLAGEPLFGTGGTLNLARPCGDIASEANGTWLSIGGAQSSTALRYSVTGVQMVSYTLGHTATAIEADGAGRIFVDGPGAAVSAYYTDFTADDFFGTDGVAPSGIGANLDMEVLYSGDLLSYAKEVHSVTMSMLDDPYGVAPQPFALPLSSLVPLSPERVLDTRLGLGAPLAKPGNNATLSVEIAGLAGVPDDGSAVAVVLNVTVAESTGPGYVSVWPSGTAQPTVSSLNYGSDGRATPNLVTVLLPPNGHIALYTYASAHLLVDVLGYYSIAFGPVAAGRFQAIDPQRVVDTRNGTGAPVAPIAPGGALDVQLTDVAGIPATGVSAVAFNLTATRSMSTGYLTAYPKGADQPNASNLNVVAAGTRANFVIAPVGVDGKITIFSSAGGDVLIDVVGWYTDDSAAPGFDGLFVPILPRRIVDTRYGGAASTAKNTVFVKQVGATSVGPAYGNIGAAVLNFTVANPLHSGWITAWPTGIPAPPVSSVNVGDDHADTANAAIVVLGIDDAGGFQVDFQTNAHLIVDMVGYYVSYFV